MPKRMEWFPAGTTFDDPPVVLHDDELVPYRVLRDVEGLVAPSWSFDSSSMPGVDGVQFSAPKASRSPLVPVFMWAESRAQLRALTSDLVAALDPARGAGKLLLSDQLGEDSGAQRWCKVIYRGGLEGVGADMGRNWWRFVLKFEAEDPYFYSVEPHVATWTGKPGVPFFPRRFPYVMSPTGLVVGSPLDLEGTAKSWPSYQLSGPWTRVKFTRNSTGESWEIARDQNYLTETLTMNTDPRLPQGPRTLDGQSRYSWLRFQSDLFPLSPGDTVSVEADGATSDSLFTLTVVPAWQTQP